jgi:hypothetical protein
MSDYHTVLLVVLYDVTCHHTFWYQFPCFHGMQKPVGVAITYLPVHVHYSNKLSCQKFNIRSMRLTDR